MVVDDLSAKTITPILRENIAQEARVMTDEAGQYQKLGKDFADRTGRALKGITGKRLTYRLT